MVPGCNSRNRRLQGMAVLGRPYRGALGLVFNLLSNEKDIVQKNMGESHGP